MAHLEGWTILNVKSRLDRRILAVGLAEAVQVPPQHIDIWEAKDAAEMEITERDDLLEAIAADGFPEFIANRTIFPKQHLGTICHLWNVCRYLRHIIECRQTRMFIHDGVQLNNSVRNFLPTYGWMNEIIRTLKEICVRKKTPFRVFLSGHRQPRYIQEYAPICPGSFIMHGILSSDNFSRVYSPEGAEFVLERFLANPMHHTNSVLAPHDGEGDAFFMTPGFFSTKVPLFRDTRG